MKKKIVIYLIRLICKYFIHFQFKGLENLPKEGGTVFVMNHISRIDSLFIYINPIRSDMSALVADKYRKHVFFRLFIDLLDHIWIDRTKADFKALKTVFTFINEGNAIIISPEGTRSKKGDLLEAKSGTVLIVEKTGAPLIPVGLTGTDALLENWFRFRKPRITVSFGPVFYLPEIKRETREEQYNQFTEEIMCRIAALIPEERHGFYAGNPLIAKFQALEKPA